MAGTPLSIRIDPDTHAVLRAAAAARGLPMASLAARLVEAGLSDATPADDADPLVSTTLALFEGVSGPEAAARREAALALARVGSAGGPAAVSAVRELRSLLAEQGRLSAAGREEKNAPDEVWDPDAI